MEGNGLFLEARAGLNPRLKIGKPYICDNLMTYATTDVVQSRQEILISEEMTASPHSLKNYTTSVRHIFINIVSKPHSFLARV